MSDLTNAPPALDGELSDAAEDISLAADDFGHLVHDEPLAVLRPGSVRDLAVVTRWATDNGLGLAARGEGHSTYGRAMVPGGIVADLRGFDDIGPVGADRVIVGAGATWRSVLAATLPQRLTPPVLTNFLDLSVGGTLSVGGAGGTTHRFGAQTDNVLELEVVTGTGEVVTCSPVTNAELFDAVRAGLGQYGIITRATLSLVPAPERVRRHVLAYTSMEALADDQRSVLQDRRTDHLQGAILAGDDGWQYQLELMAFHAADDDPGDDLLSGLSDDRSRAQIDDVSYAEYVHTFDRLTAMLRSTGGWSTPHPWLYGFLPGTTAVQAMRELVGELSADDLGQFGRVLFYPVPSTPLTTPLLRVPDEPELFAFGMVRFAPTPERASAMVEQNRSFHKRIRAAGGTLYPVSALPFSTADWEDHYGPLWPTVVAAKERFDPAGVLTPGYRVR